MAPTRRDPCGRPASRFEDRPELVARPVSEARNLEDLLTGSCPSFGGGYLRRVWRLLDEAVGRGVPMTLAVSGPVTASGQHLAWLNPLLETGWFCALSTTDAVCYHDGHRSLREAAEHSFREVPIHGDDGGLREEAIIRITDIGFPEEILLGQDRFLRQILRRPEFQRRMSGTEFRNLLGRAYAEVEKAHGAPEGLLALCRRKAIPVFVGAPSDGSVFLNSLALWATEPGHAFDLDLHLEVFESCAIHWWGVRESESRALGTLILGGGVPKNFNLQPEPALSQILGLADVPGYLYDIQITTAPVSDGSLSSCPPAEAVTWGKVDKDHYRRTTESMPADYSMVMPVLVQALLEKRDRLRAEAEAEGLEAWRARNPDRAGWLRDPAGYRLYERREELLEALRRELRRRRSRTADT